MSSSVATRLEQLAVEQSDTFFFDHPLDHVPGMVLFDGLLRAARDAHAESTGDAEPARIRAALDFTRICESDQPTTLSCTPADCGGWSVSAIQNGREVCVGTFGFVPTQSAASAHGFAPATTPEAVPAAAQPGAASPSAPSKSPAPARLVHRSRPENILVGEVTRPPIESLLLDPPDGHVLLRTDPRFRSTIELVEAGRQFMVMLAHTEGGAAMDTRMLWLSLTADIPARLPRDEPALLRCIEHSGNDQRMICTVLLAEAETGTELGILNYITRNVDPARYARLRTR